MKVLGSLIATLIYLLSLLSSLFSFAASQRNNTKRHTLCTSLSQSAVEYYKDEYTYGRLCELSGAKDVTDSYSACRNNELYTALQTLMTQTHTCFTTYSGYKKGSIAYYWSYTDCDKGNSSYLMFYSDTHSDSEGVSFSREHVWPKSKASFSKKLGGADLHHLRPSDSSVNNAKSNYAFGYVNGAFLEGNTAHPDDSSAIYWINPSNRLFEPKDDVKGDVARILLYVYCRWGQPNLYSDVDASLLPEADSDDETNSGEAVIESLDTLLNWCEDDPVDEWEMRRNDLVESIQGNRNVFIDYPELAWKMFSREVPAGLTTPSLKGCNHKWRDVGHEDPTCTQDGFNESACKKCGEQRRFVLHCIGHTDSNRDEYCDVCSEKLSVTTGLKLLNTFTDGSRIVLYHPKSKTAVSYASADNRKLSAVNAYINGSELSVADGYCVFDVIEADGGYYLCYGGQYLTSGETGNSLFFTEEPNEYSIWTSEKDKQNPTVVIFNKNALYDGNAQALEYYRNGFTTYSYNDSDKYVFEIYGNVEH